MLPTHVFLGSKREMSRGKKKKLSIQETGKCMQINRSIFNPETFFHSSISKQKRKPQSLSPAPGKNTSSIRKPPNNQRVYQRRQQVSEEVQDLMKQKVDPIHSQKSHNILQLLKSLNKITPRKNEQKIKFRS